MKRIIDYYLKQWKHDPQRKSLLLRGARQVGKTHAIRKLGKTFENFVEINLEQLSQAHEVFEKDLIPSQMINKLSSLTGQPIIPEKTLLFIDEIQVVPRAIIALRYFFEQMPQLHVIGAGSLLDFAIEKVGVPVGRVQFLHMYPLSFIEFMVATGKQIRVQEIFKSSIKNEMSDFTHKLILNDVAEYIVIGGMPLAVLAWSIQKNALASQKEHHVILNAYKQDFGKYSREHQLKYVELIFKEIPRQLGKKFKFHVIEGEYRKRELSPAMDLLATAGVIHRVYYTAGQGIPLGTQMDPTEYKAIFLDVGLCQSVLDFDISDWFINPEKNFINKGAIVEAFVGQELLAYSNPDTQTQLYYWRREERTSNAEIDYLIQKQNAIIPIEIKSGHGNTLKSMQLFLESHPQSPYGIRFSTQNYSIFEKIHSYPLYAITQMISENKPELKMALESLFE